MHHYLHEVFAYHVIAALNDYEQNQTLQLMAAEAVYGRNSVDDRGPPPGRAVTNITRLDEVDGGLYFEVPLTHANRNCLVRQDDDRHSPLAIHVTNNCVYIPVNKFEDAFEDFLIDGTGSVIDILEDVFWRSLTDNTIKTIANRANKVDTKIKKLLEASQTRKIYAEQRYPERLRVLLKAVDEAPNDIAQLGQPLKASEIFDAVDWCLEQKPGYDNDDISNNLREYEQARLDTFDSARSISNYLQKEQEENDHDDVTINKGKRYNTYVLEYSPWGSSKNVNIESIEDLHELPCMENLHEHLLEEKPVRWVLYSWARIVFSLDNDFGVEDIVDHFREMGYPWFDEQTTRYQADYEKDRTMDDTGEKPLPIGCNNDNDNFSQFCIGKENCDYSIYTSLPFKQEVYDRLPDRDRHSQANRG